MKAVKKYGMMVILIGCIVFGIYHFCVIPVKIQGISMENTLHDQDIALIHSYDLKREDLRRFDVVVIDSEAMNEKIIKRVIGLPHETVQLKDDILYINGESVEQPFLNKKFVLQKLDEHKTKHYTSDFQITLEDDEYFVLGDSRLDSTDSRHFGPVRFEEIKGSRGMIIFPFAHMNVIE